MTEETSLVPCSDMATFSPETIKRASDLLGVHLDEAAVIRALIIQQDTGLSIARGEISVVPFNGKPTVFVNKQGYLAYASRHEQYDGYEWGVEGNGDSMHAWCRVYRKDHSRPVYEDAWFSEDRKNTPIWTQMPKRMLAKVAIKRAHQAAFPVLNGLLTPEEVDDTPAFRIQKDDNCIDVQPVEIRETKPKQPEVTPSRIYTAQQAEDILQNYVSRGWTLEVFDSAKRSDGTWNGDVINADFKMKSTAEKVAKTAKVEPKSACPKCGKPSMTAEDVTHMQHLAEGATFDHALCKDCAREWWKEAKLGMEVEPAKPEPEKTEDLQRPFCNGCGERRVTKEEETISRNFAGKPLCSTCLQKHLKSLAPKEEPKEEPKAEPAPAPEPKYKCSKCGVEMTANEWGQQLMFAESEDKVTCSKCMDAQEEEKP